MSSKKKGNPADAFALDLPLPKAPARTAVPDDAAARFVGDATPRPPATAPRERPEPHPAPDAPAAPPDAPAAPPEAPRAAPASPKAPKASSASSASADPEPPAPKGRRVRVRKTDGVPMRRTTVWLRVAQAKRLALFCADREVSQTDVIDEALTAYFERQGG